MTSIPVALAYLALAALVVYGIAPEVRLLMQARTAARPRSGQDGPVPLDWGPSAAVTLDAPATFGVRNYRPLKEEARIASADYTRALAIDLSACGYVDSSALGCLVGISKRLQANGAGPLALVRPQPDVHKLLHMTGLDTLFLVGRPVADGKEVAA